MAVRGMNRDDHMHRRVGTAFLAILACYLGLVGRLVFLQGLHGGEIRAEATRQRERKFVLSAELGAIQDRNGRPLASSLYSGSVGFDPSVLTEPESAAERAKLNAKLEAGIPCVAPLLGMSDEEMASRIRAAIAAYAVKPRRFFPLKNGVGLELAQQLRAIRRDLPGLEVVDGRQRVYSSGPSAAQVVGFVDAKGVGEDGLERGCRTWLSGANGYAMAEVDNHHREIPDTLQKIQPKRDGYDVHTTLDADAQRIAEEEAQKVYAKFRPQGVSVVILDPTTSDVLALVSLPTFDANPEPGRPGRRPAIPFESQRDRCVGSLYEPGSTLKPLTVAAALDADAISPTQVFHCPPQMKIGARSIHEAHAMPHLDLDVESILRYSCNVGAAQIGLLLGGQRLEAADRKFGLFDSLGLPLPREVRGRWSQDPHEDRYSRAKTARAAFGQAITTTPMHVALAYAAIANGGVLMRPRLVTSITAGDGKVVKECAPRIARQATSSRAAATVAAMLRDVVTEGTGTGAAIPGYQVAGKTGTATKYHRKDAYVGSFAGFGPATPGVKPRMAILVVVDEPDAKKAYYGADVAAPAFQAIASRLLKLWRVPQDDPTSMQARQAQALERRKQGLPPIAVARNLTE